MDVIAQWVAPPVVLFDDDTGQIGGVFFEHHGNRPRDVTLDRNGLIARGIAGADKQFDGVFERQCPGELLTQGECIDTRSGRHFTGEPVLGLDFVDLRSNLVAKDPYHVVA